MNGYSWHQVARCWSATNHAPGQPLGKEPASPLRYPEIQNLGPALEIRLGLRSGQEGALECSWKVLSAAKRLLEKLVYGARADDQKNDLGRLAR